jgi:NAD(P)-dependent dehydrogenase (short-subunit alcohol dehydrogenase family)
MMEGSSLSMQIKDSVFVVSGGASGLGAACVRRLTSQGAKVLAADLNEQAGSLLAGEIGASCAFIQMDVTSEPDVQAALDLAVARWGRLDGVINCAGIGTPERVLSKEGQPHSLKSFSKIIEVNLIGTFNLIRLAVAVMVRTKPDTKGERGIIIDTASVAAFEGQIGQAAYAASKGGVISMMLPIARELSRQGIRIMTIAPGIFDTPMLGTLSNEVKSSLGQQVPFPSRLGRPEEYAQLAQAIIENEMLNGEVIRLDGALRMGPK